MRTRDRPPLPWWVRYAPVFVGVALRVLERARPLRRQTQPALRRDARNLAVAAVGGAALGLTQSWLMPPLLRRVERRRWGLLNRLRLSGPVKTGVAVLLMDYTLYLWHRLTHVCPPLWRFHEAHHADLDLSATTGLRFHFGELLLSVPWRAAQVVLIGVPPRAFALWEIATVVQVLFHHANLRLPEPLDRALALLVVTPRLHGIHHSVRKAETDSNWGTILSVFDRWHGTLRLDVAQADLTIGVPGRRDPQHVTLVRTLLMPFGA